MANIKEHFKDREIIVRSSAQNEDTIYESMAGAYDSVKNIIPDNEIQLTNGIDRVVKSYGKDNNEKMKFLSKTWSKMSRCLALSLHMSSTPVVLTLLLIMMMFQD